MSPVSGTIVTSDASRVACVVIFQAAAGGDTFTVHQMFMPGQRLESSAYRELYTVAYERGWREGSWANPSPGYCLNSSLLFEDVNKHNLCTSTECVSDYIKQCDLLTNCRTLKHLQSIY